MIMQYERLCQHPTIFKAMTGLTLPEFEDLLADVLPRLISADRDRRSRPQRRRAPGAGRPYTLSERDQVLLTVIWLRRYPTHEVLGYLFGMPDWTARRAILRVLPVLEASGLDRMRMPDPGRKRRRSLDDLLAEPPELIVLSIPLSSASNAIATGRRRIAITVARKSSTPSKARSWWMKRPGWSAT